MLAREGMVVLYPHNHTCDDESRKDCKVQNEPALLASLIPPLTFLQRFNHVQHLCHSAIAGVSAPAWIARSVRVADNLFLAAEMAACIVVGGVVLEDWDKFGMFFYRPSWITARNVIGPIMVAGGIALEIVLSNRASHEERKCATGIPCGSLN
jgi:hypothetical protein